MEWNRSACGFPKVTLLSEVAMVALSYSFVRYRINDEVVLRPCLKCTLVHGSRSFDTYLLVDSGADCSMLRREEAIDGLGIDVTKLRPIGQTGGIGGSTDVAIVEVDLRFGQRQHMFEMKMPMQVSLEEGKDPSLSLLGRNPFFYKFRVDFRMGYTDDPTLGKFILYPEDNPRNAAKFKKPPAYG